MKEVCGTSDLEIGRGYVKQVEIVGDDRSSPRKGLGLSEGRSHEGRCDESAVGEAGGAALGVGCPGGAA
jgi:hypothetical protein